MNPVATYSFLPWLRQGLANTITAQDGDTSVKLRASTHVQLQISGDPVGGGTELTTTVDQDIALYGPGDVVGIDQRAVIRTDPHHWITNFEGNYLAAVDFTDADFPWRYTPSAPDQPGLKLRPWITLVVLTPDEFSEGRDVASRPAPYIDVPSAAVFPPAGELWAWAHVHVNDILSADPSQLVAPDMTEVVPKLAAVIAANPDLAYARLLCPRRLADSSAYHAFVIPTFETGRLAGLGLDPGGAPHATFSAWDQYQGKPEPTHFPVYFRWFFRTGTAGDFEYLVDLLKPQPADPRVGIRPMDVTDPGSGIPGIAFPIGENLPPKPPGDLNGVLRLGGALQVPDADLTPEQLAERQAYENWDQPYPDTFEQSMAAFVNRPDDYAASGLGGDPDPLITAPLYGRWPSLTQRLLTNRDGTAVPDDANWVHRLNLDPRFRVPAAYGAQVVEANAEAYMNDAWQQIGDVLAANSAIRRLHLATGVATRWWDAHLAPLAAAVPERAFALLAPVAGRVLTGAKTLAFTRSGSLIQPALTSTAMRRVIRPGGRLIQSLPAGAISGLLARVNAGQVSAAPPKQVPPGLPTVDKAVPAAAAPDTPSWAVALLAALPWLPGAVLAAAVLLLILGLILLFLVPAAGVVLLALAVLAGVSYLLLNRWRMSVQRENAIDPARQTPSSVAGLPLNPGFTLIEPGSTVSSAPGRTDSPTAVRFKAALTDSYDLLQAGHAAGRRPPPVVLPLAQATTASVAAIEPAVTIAKRGMSLVDIPPWIRDLIGDSVTEVMAYPRIDLPMYEPLKDISVELFLPNINLVAPNSITLVETNQRFVEAYLVGLNHEFARKLLWREYPCDQRGSYFRQFWDVNSYIDSEGLSQDPLREKLYDIPELHTWPPASALGAHNNRGGPAQAVLVIRGELLKKYPNTMIYAQRAVWPVLEDGQIDLSVPRSLVDLTPAEELQPPRDKIRSPLYEAKADPDIYFLGFDLTIAEARGGTGENPGDDPGWFFVLRQRPGEPRFGLETARPGVLDVFDELTWDDAVPGGTTGEFLPAGALSSVALVAPSPPEPDRQVQHDDDEQVDPAAESAARWAYLLYRAPVLVAVHAAQMLGS